MPRPLSQEQDQNFEEAFLASTSPLILGFYVMRHTGIRIGELRGLAFDCVRSNLDGQPLLKVPLGKMDNDRLVPLAPKTLDVIKKLQGIARKDQSAAWTPQTLFVSRRGRQYAIGAFHRAFLDVKLRLILDGRIIEARDEPINPHRLRHTYATTLLTGGISIVVLQKLLGHRSIRMTLRYAAVVPTKAIEDYFAALKILAARQQYLEPVDRRQPSARLGHRKLVADLILLLRSHDDGAAPAKIRRTAEIIRKVEQLGRDIAKL
jgi:integrase